MRTRKCRADAVLEGDQLFVDGVPYRVDSTDTYGGTTTLMGGCLTMGVSP